MKKVEKVIRHADAEGDGKLSFEDFLEFMREWENETEERELERELAARLGSPPRTLAAGSRARTYRNPWNLGQ